MSDFAHSLARYCLYKYWMYFMLACSPSTDLTIWTHKATHVFHHTDDWQFDLLAEADLLSNILQRHLLEEARLSIRS